MAVVSSLSASAMSSLEAMLGSLMGMPKGGGDETPRDDDDVTESSSPSPSPAPAPSPPLLPVRPTPRGRLPSLPRFVGGPWTTPSSPSPPKEGDAAWELERKAVEVEARLRQKEAENAALRQQIESYHVRWLEYEIKIKSLEEAFHEQMAYLQMAREEAARRADELPAYDDRRRSSVDDKHRVSENQASGRLRHGSCHRASGARRISAVGRLGAEFRRESQALESGAEALVEPWQPGVPSANSMDDLRKLKAQFRAWKKGFKARLRSAKAEIDRDRRRRSACWI